MNKISTRLIALVAVVIMLVSCGSKNALEFNNKLVTIQKSLMTEVNNMKTDTTGALEKLQRMQNVTKTKIKEIADLKSPEGGEGFKEAMMDDFQGIISSYDILIDMVKKKDNPAEVDALQEQLNGWQTKIEVLDKKVLDEQKKFANKYNIKLQ